ncbi:hypothetical protein LXA43DRAFT_633266 [Ganoderma leucocontextum]|nr:hypothetical protein LXA43DRAFT_633266 [Ganoderma leucocontextum]
MLRLILRDSESRIFLRTRHTNIPEVMGKATKALLAFINGIPDDKLKDIGESQHTIYQDSDFRLDMQGVSTPSELSSQSVVEWCGSHCLFLQMTSGEPKRYNLQVQINKQTTISTLKKHQPATVAIYLANKTDSPATIRQGLLSGMKI